MKEFFRKTWILCLCFVLLTAGTVSYAWISSASRRVQTEHLTVDMPPILYILDSRAQDMAALNLEGITPGETQYVVFCISSVYQIDESAPNYKTAFSLEVAYTGNLKASVRLHPVTICNTPPASGTEGTDYLAEGGYYYEFGDAFTGAQDISAAQNEIAYGGVPAANRNNEATYLLYDKYDGEQPDGTENMIFTDPEVGAAAAVAADPDTEGGNQLFNSAKYLYYAVEIYWEAGVDLSTVDAKETDIIYVIANGVSGGV